jgi:hypothetical protein
MSGFNLRQGGMPKEKIPSGYRKGSIKNFDQNQMPLYESLFSHLGPDSYLSRLAGGDESLFGEMEAPAMRQFGELTGDIASRFSLGGGGQGAMSGRRSSGFQNTMGQAASNFAQDLQARRQELRRQALSDLMGMSNTLLGQRPYENFMVQKSPSFMEQMAPGLGQGIGLGAVSKLGGLF